MTKPRDPVDAWLDADVQLMHPSPDAYQRISRRARRRKTVQAMVTVAGAAVLIGGLAEAPRLATFFPGGSKTASSIAQGLDRTDRHHPAARRSAPAVFGTGNLAPVAEGIGRPTGVAAPRLAPTSVTFVGPTIGAVLGQSRPGCATEGCTRVAGTSSYGQRWYGVGAPAAGSPSGASGVSQLRFLNLRDGWAFGPSLWHTTDGGRNWRQSALVTAGPRAARVIALEALDGAAYALVGTCTGGGARYGARCTSYTLYRSPASADNWQPVPGAGKLTAPAGHAAAALVLAGGTGSPATDSGYLLTPSGVILGGNLAGSPWGVVSPRRCAPGPALANGQPSRTVIASPAAGTLYMVCSLSAYVHAVCQWSAAQGWVQVGTVPAPGPVTSLAAQPGGLLVVTTAGGLLRSGDSGKTWLQTRITPQVLGSAPVFSYVGMTTPKLGVAVPADPGFGAVYVTSDGGLSWRRSPV